MPEFKDLSSDAGLAQLNEHLSSRSYIEGFAASKADSATLLKVKAGVDSKKYPHVARWFNHISHFSPLQRSLWGGAGKCESKSESKAAGSPVKAAAKKPADDDDDDSFNVSLDDDDGESAAEIAARKNAEKEASKKKEDGGKKKDAPIGKSTLVLDVKPNDSDTDLALVEKKIRAIQQEGLVWGACERKPIAYGIEKLRILAIVVDDLVSTDAIQEQIEAFEEVQSTDVHAFNKL